MPWTKVEDVRRRHHRPIPTGQEHWVASLIDDAEDKLSLKVADLAARVDSGEVPAERVKRIVADALIPLLLNPEGATSQSTTRGPFANSITRPAPTGAGRRIAFSEEDLDSLRPAVLPAGSVRLGLSPWQVP